MMGNKQYFFRAELLHILRDPTFIGLLVLLLLSMAGAIWNGHIHLQQKKAQLQEQLIQVEENDRVLMAQIDSLERGLATYSDSYTLPTSGVRLTYNNHRLAWMPINDLSLLAIGQSDVYSNYKKIVLYFNDSYELSTQELASPIKQLFGQLDLAFLWVYFLPLVIILISFNLLSIERETGRLPLVASQAINIRSWILSRHALRLVCLWLPIVLTTLGLLIIFGVPMYIDHLLKLGALFLLLFLYMAFWFLLCFLVNLLGLNSGQNLILLVSSWVLFIFLIPSTINQLGKEWYPIPSRLEIVNHHQKVYNEMEADLANEIEKLYQIYPHWASDDPVTKDMSHPTGWNIQYLAKQYIAQVKHQPIVQAYETKVDHRNEWFRQLRILSPSMVLQVFMSDIAGSSNRYYRIFLKQAQQYAHDYRQYTFERLFNNYAFKVEDIAHLPTFEFDKNAVSSYFWNDLLVLIIDLIFLMALVLFTNRMRIKII